jgi:hypothetical protein
MNPAILYPLIGAIVLLVMLVIGVLTQRKSAARGWEALGKKHGLAYERGREDHHKLTGTYRGRPLDAQIRYRVAGSTSVPVMNIDIGVNNTDGSRIVLACESTIVGNLLGSEDIGIGDAEFDSTFKIVSQPDDLVKRVFTSDAALRQRITALKSDKFNLTIYEGKLLVETLQLQRDMEGMQAVLDAVVDLAEAVEKA